MHVLWVISRAGHYDTVMWWAGLYAFTYRPRSHDNATIKLRVKTPARRWDDILPAATPARVTAPPPCPVTSHPANNIYKVFLVLFLYDTVGCIGWQIWSAGQQQYRAGQMSDVSNC